MKLSILVCTIPERKRLFDRLINTLHPQITGEIEILSDNDTNISIGEKRNNLLAKATGKYVAFVDDDDLVCTEYVPKVMFAISQQPDCVGIEIQMTIDGAQSRSFVQSLKFPKPCMVGQLYCRHPSHINPMMRELAMREPFPHLNYREDADFSNRMLKHLKTEVFIDGPIYFYHYKSKKDTVVIQ